MNKNYIIVLDFETGGKDKFSCPILSLAALVLHPRTLDPIRDKSGNLEEFYSLMKPPKEEFINISDEALSVNKLTIEEINNAPDQSHVWGLFENFINRFNKTGKDWDSPILAGFNVINFDRYLVDRMKVKYSKSSKSLFHPRDYFDVMNILLWWFESSSDISSYSLDNQRKYFGMPQDKDALIGEVVEAHNAKRDIRDSAALLKKFILLKRNLQKNYDIKFQGAFRGD